MKKLMVAIIGLVSLAGVPAQGQADNYPEWNGVLFGGWSRSTLSGTNQPFEDAGSRNGGTAGVAFLVRMQEGFGLELGARVTQKGADGAVDLTDYTQDVNASTPRVEGDGTTALTYLEFPFNVAGYLTTGAHSYLRGYVGLSFGVLMSAEFSGVLDGADTTVDIKDKLKGGDFCWVIGASATRAMSGYSLWLDARYVGGTQSLDDSGRDYDFKTSTSELALGIGIPLGR